MIPTRQGVNGAFLRTLAQRLQSILWHHPQRHRSNALPRHNAPVGNELRRLRRRRAKAGVDREDAQVRIKTSAISQLSPLEVARSVAGPSCLCMPNARAFCTASGKSRRSAGIACASQFTAPASLTMLLPGALAIAHSPVKSTPPPT